jgi:Bacteriophage Lambda NinG protein
VTRDQAICERQEHLDSLRRPLRRIKGVIDPSVQSLLGKFDGILRHNDSTLIRRRDFQRYGTCISCGKAVSDWREFDAGHFIPAGSGGFSLLFDERNLNGECPYDNAFNGAHLLLYRRGLDSRYGPGTADALEERYRDSHFKGKITKEWSKKEYEAKIIEIKEKLATLSAVR